MLTSLTAHELGARYRSGAATPTQATTEYLARIERLDPQVRAFLTVTREDALRRAAESDARFKAGAPRGPLDGVPVALKDLFCTRGIRTTSGSKILDRFVPPSGVTEPEPDDDFPFRLGAKLRHARWGEGLLVGIQREGADVIATVHFASVGRKRLSLQYAHLEEI